MEEPHVSFADLTLTDFSGRLASSEPVPGGGSASAVVGSIAASLLAMVARLSLDRPKYEPYRSSNERALAAGDRARTRLLQMADEDAAAYAAFSNVRRMPRETSQEIEKRDELTRSAARHASEVPMAIVGECADLIDQIEALAGRSNTNASSDLLVAARLAAAAAHGAGANVMINLPMVDDDSYAGGMTARLDGLFDDVDRTLSNISQLVARGGLREPEAG